MRSGRGRMTSPPPLLSPFPVSTSAAGTVTDRRPSRRPQYSLRAIPKLVVAKQGRPPTRYDSSYEYSFRYRSKRHVDLPHVVKFSGGRSSGMLLLVLLKNKLLDAKRGDVIVFNNTAAEHPETYKFIAACKEIAEDRFGIPFFWVEYQTYEDARGGEWTRVPTYRLTNSEPWSLENPDGYCHKGEPFEEMLSWTGYVPNQFRRTCTRSLKLESTRMFLHDWLACKESIPRLGHWEEKSQINLEDLYHRHLQNNGTVPKNIFLGKKKFVLSRPAFRPEQFFADFTNAPVALDNPVLDGNAYGENAEFGLGGVEYIALIGLRGDEGVRVQRVAARASGGSEAQGYEGEHVYMPLDSIRVSKDDVTDFWSRQNWSLDLPEEGYLSNCVYCFLKGTANLKQVHQAMELNGNGSATCESHDRPTDIGWWARIESLYGRDLKAEGRRTKKESKVEFLGFFGSDGRITYRTIADLGGAAFASAQTMLPCDCTD